MSLTLLLQQLINGVSLGSLYALIAIGYTMVYGILRLINFAHGDLLMVTAYAAMYGVLLFSLPWFVSFPLAVIATGAIGILLDRAAYKPLRQAPRISLLISAIGASFLMENLALVFIGGVPKPFPRPDFFGYVIKAGDLHIMVLTIYSPIVTLLLVLGLLYIVFKTRAGMAMRAASRDFEATRLMGINLGQDHCPYFPSRLEPGGGKRDNVGDEIPADKSVHGGHTRSESFHCCGYRRDRKHRRRCFGWFSAWTLRNSHRGPFAQPGRVPGCVRFFGPYRSAAFQTDRDYG